MTLKDVLVLLPQAAHCSSPWSAAWCVVLPPSFATWFKWQEKQVWSVRFVREERKGFLFPIDLNELFTNWTCKINPDDLGNIPCVLSGYENWPCKPDGLLGFQIWWFLKFLQIHLEKLESKSFSGAQYMIRPVSFLCAEKHKCDRKQEAAAGL